MKKENLLVSLEAVRPGLAAKDIIESAQSFIFTGKDVLTYNDEVSVRLPLATEFQGAVPSAPLLAFLKKASGEEVGLVATENELQLKCGRTKAGIPMLSTIPEHLTSLKIPAKGWQAIGEGFLHAVQMASGVTSRDMSRPVLTCVHIAGNVVEGGDNFRFVRYHLKDEAPACLLPASCVKELAGFKPTEILVTEAWVHFRNPTKAVFSRRINSGTYVELDPIFKLGKEVLRIAFPDKLQPALERTGVFAVTDFDADRQVKLTAKGGRLTVRAEGADGWCEEVLSLEGKPEFAFAIHPTMLMEVLEHTKTAELDVGKIMFRDKNFEYVLAL